MPPPLPGRELKDSTHWASHADCASVGWQIFYSLRGSRVMKLAARLLKRARTCTSNDYLRQFIDYEMLIMTIFMT